MPSSRAPRGPFLFLAGRNGLPAFRAGVGVRIVLAGGSTVIPGVVLDRWRHRTGRGAVDRGRSGVIILRGDGSADGQAGNGQYGCRADPAGATMVMVVSMAAVAAVAAPVGLSGRRRGQGKGGSDTEGGKRFHDSTRFVV